MESEKNKEIKDNNFFKDNKIRQFNEIVYFFF